MNYRSLLATALLSCVISLPALAFNVPSVPTADEVAGAVGAAADAAAGAAASAADTAAAAMTEENAAAAVGAAEETANTASVVVGSASRDTSKKMLAVAVDQLRESEPERAELISETGNCIIDEASDRQIIALTALGVAAQPALVAAAFRKMAKTNAQKCVTNPTALLILEAIPDMPIPGF